MMQKSKSVTILSEGTSSNKLFKEIVSAINGYLVKNSGNAADFHIIKNIVDRHIETVDEEINHMLPVPLYLGLAATMVGIICGLLSLDGSVATQDFVNSIAHLIDSIKYAMACSLVGLLMTTFLTAWCYRRAKARMERQVNELLNFVQMELLPHLNKDPMAVLLNMQARMEAFNGDFESNIDGLYIIMDDVRASFDSQLQLVQKMSKMDMVQMARFNQNVLVQLNDTMTKFETFAEYLNKMNAFISSTASLTDSINNQLDRTHSIEIITNSVQRNIDNNERVMNALQEFLEKVEADKAVLVAANSIDVSVAQAMDTMRNHVNAQVEEIRNHTAKATEDLDLLMSRERGQLDKLKNLDKMDSLIKALENMALDNKVLTESLARRIASLSSSIDQMRDGTSATHGLHSAALWIVTILLGVASVTVILKFFFNIGM